jgi:hypothetical protein
MKIEYHRKTIFLRILTPKASHGSVIHSMGVTHPVCTGGKTFLPIQRCR